MAGTLFFPFGDQRNRYWSILMPGMLLGTIGSMSLYVIAKFVQAIRFTHRNINSVQQHRVLPNDTSTGRRNSRCCIQQRLAVRLCIGGSMHYINTNFSRSKTPHQIEWVRRTSRSILVYASLHFNTIYRYTGFLQDRPSQGRY
jgi:hypothetical protein